MRPAIGPTCVPSTQPSCPLTPAGSPWPRPSRRRRSGSRGCSRSSSRGGTAGRRRAAIVVPVPTGVHGLPLIGHTARSEQARAGAAQRCRSGRCRTTARRSWSTCRSERSSRAARRRGEGVQHAGGEVRSDGFGIGSGVPKRQLASSAQERVEVQRVAVQAPVLVAISA